MDPMADRSGLSSALAHSKADATEDKQEAELHDGSVRLGPSVALDHAADVIFFVCATLPVHLQQLGVDGREVGRG